MKIYRVVVGTLDTNCYIVASDKMNAFIIDPGDDAELIKEVLSKHSLSPVFIVNTHGHIDHIKADVDLDLPVFIHKEDEKMVIEPKNNIMTSFFGTFKPVTPKKILNGGDVLELDELSFKIIHTPGHTMGCICLFGSGVLFSGDTLFRNGVGRTDFPGASQGSLEASLKILAGLPRDTVVYPGHGQDTTIARELG